MKKHTNGTIIVDGIPYDCPSIDLEIEGLEEGEELGLPNLERPRVAWVIFDEQLAANMDPPDAHQVTPEEIRRNHRTENMVELIIEQAYDQFIDRQAGAGPYSTQSRFDAFRWSVRDAIAHAETLRGPDK